MYIDLDFMIRMIIILEQFDSCIFISIRLLVPFLVSFICDLSQHQENPNSLQLPLMPLNLRVLISENPHK